MAINSLELVTNFGTIKATSGGDAYGTSTAYGDTVINHGHIIVGGANRAVGVFFYNNGFLNNDGDITVTSSAGQAVGALSGRIEFGGTVFQNSGTISATAVSGQMGIGVWLDGYDGTDPITPNLINLGVISGSSYSVRGGGARDFIQNSGTLNGAVDLGYNPDKLFNNGQINGAIDMGVGDDLLDSTGGWIVGAINLGDGNDRFFGGGSNDSVLGGVGEDTLSGGDGNDTLSGENGSDNLQGGNGADVLSGGSGPDTLDGGAGNDQLDGGDGDDILSDLAGINVYNGGLGTDTAGLSLSDRTGALVYAVGDANVSENGGALVTMTSIERVLIKGGSGNDTFTGGALADTLDGGAGADTLSGGAGDDTYVVDQANDVVIEGSNAGNDTVRVSISTYALPANVENIIYTGPGSFTVQAGSSAVNLTGGAGGDTLIGSAAGGTLDGGDGADVLWFYGASTTLIGGAGFDYAIQLDAAGQTRSIGSTGIEVYVANSGNDTINATGAATTTIIYGGAGNDAVTQSAVGGYVFGQDGNDSLIGGDGQDIFLGGAGADNIMGFGGNDVLYIDSADAIAFDGGAGIDYAIVDTATAVSVDLTTRNVEVFIGNLGNDTINAGGTTGPMGLYGFGGDDVMTSGTSGGNQMFGQDGNDILNSGAGGDVVLGGNGNDQIFGNAGDDLILGEVGNDIIVGGLGADVMWGGAGDDTFRIAASDLGSVQDLIADFGDTTGDNDVINFTGITAGQITITNCQWRRVAFHRRRLFPVCHRRHCNKHRRRSGFWLRRVVSFAVVAAGERLFLLGGFAGGEIAKKIPRRLSGGRGLK